MLHKGNYNVWVCGYKLILDAINLMIAIKQLFPVVLYKVVQTLETIDEFNSTHDQSKERYGAVFF